MFRHIVLFKYRADATTEQKTAVQDGLAGSPAAIPVIRSFVFGPDAGAAQGNFDFALVADFDSREDYLAYQQHPVHVEFVTSSVRPIAEARAAVQHEW
jgi:Stress responsive A/B Barrel Domain